MRSILVLTAASLALAACATGPAPVVTPSLPPVVVAPPIAPPVTQPSGATRAAAVSIVNREMAQRLPGVNVMPYTGCVVNNATDAELADLASMGPGGAGAAGAVAAIVKRPATTSCIAGLSRTT